MFYISVWNVIGITNIIFLNDFDSPLNAGQLVSLCSITLLWSVEYYTGQERTPYRSFLLCPFLFQWVMLHATWCTTFTSESSWARASHLKETKNKTWTAVCFLIISGSAVFEQGMWHLLCTFSWFCGDDWLCSVCVRRCSIVKLLTFAK